MSRHDPSLPVTPPETLAEVLDRLEANATISPVQHRDLASAVRAVARFADLPPGGVMVDIPRLRSILETVQPARYKIGPGRLANIRSQFVFALGVASVEVEPLRLEVELTAEWAELRRRLPAGDANMLVRFMRHCSRISIAPVGVTDPVVVDYAHSLETRSFVQNPRKHVQNVVRTWNRVARSVEGWPGVRLTPLRSRETILLPASTFPESFRVELRKWLDRLAGGDPLADMPLRPLRPTTLWSHNDNLLRAASILVRRGVPVEEIRSLSCMVDLENAKTVMRWFLERHGGKPSRQSHNLGSILQVLARHGVKLESARLEPLEAALRKCRMRSDGGMTPKNRATIRVFEDERLVHEFWDLPERLMRRALSGEQIGKFDAYLAAQALAIAILSCAPVRIENLYSIEVNRHVVRSGSGRGARVHLAFPDDEVKNRRAIELPLSDEAQRLLERYLTKAWPLLGGQDCPFLFPGRAGGKRSKIGFGMAIAKTVERELGVRVTPHQFRHLCGFLYLRHWPGDYETVRGLLGHKSVATTLSFYAGMETVEAGRRFDEVVRGKRRPRPRGAR